MNTHSIEQRLAVKEIVKGYVTKWVTLLDIGELVDGKYTVEIGDLDELDQENGFGICDGADTYAMTYEWPDGSHYKIGIDTDCPPDKLEEVVLHRLLHVVHGLFKSNGDEFLVYLAARSLLAHDTASAGLDMLNEKLSKIRIPDGLAVA